MQSKVFVDTAFVVALISKNDQYHENENVLITFNSRASKA